MIMNEPDDGPFSDRLRVLVDLGADNCATRRKFWENLKERGFEFAFKKYVTTGHSNAFTANLVKERYEQEFRDRERKARTEDDHGASGEARESEQND